MCSESMSDHELQAGTHERARRPHLMGRARILIVEDEADLAWVEQFNLESEGYEVRVALEGRAAIDALDSFRPQVMVLVVSAVAGVGDQVRTGTMGVGSFLPKPFDIDDLVRVVGETFASNGLV